MTMISEVSKGIYCQTNTSLTHGLNTEIILLGYSSPGILMIYSVLWVYYIMFLDQTFTRGRMRNKWGRKVRGRREVRIVTKQSNRCKQEKLRAGKINRCFISRGFLGKQYCRNSREWASLPTCTYGSCAFNVKLYTFYNNIFFLNNVKITNLFG